MLTQSLGPAAGMASKGATCIERRPQTLQPGILAAYFESADQAIMLIDARGRIAVCTDKASRLLGLPSGDIVLGRLAGPALRRVFRGTGETRSDTIQRLRRAFRERRRIRQDGLIGGTMLAVDMRPLADAGWAVTVSDSSTAVVGRQRADGSLDTLTGLPNRAFFAMRLKQAEERLRLTGEGFAVLAIDLDRFKQVNDTLGHPIGDALLCKVAERLQTTLKPGDTLARLGGDEFAVLQSGGPDEAGTTTLARRIVDLVGRAYVVEGHLINVGASVGAARAPTDGAEPDLLLKQADLALYRAKLDGRDTFRFFTPEMMARMEARRLLELDLRKALAMREFELVYQPQLNLGSERLVGCEALIRWHHPTRGTVSPADFVPLAEEIGLIVTIGEWVIRTACLEAVCWPSDLSVAVNLSPAQFKSKKLVDTVASALATSGLAPQRLELEITEGVLLQENEANLATLHALRDLGLRISLDDFGTGYSSLSYLRAFPFDKIKIDRSFVSGKAAEGDSMAIIRAIASLGASFGMTTVAEGVETAEQMRRIREEGCTDVQGYFVSRPISANAIGRLFMDQSRCSLVSHQP